jgi:negative regulator of flagellin synthesis FlgM
MSQRIEGSPSTVSIQSYRGTSQASSGKPAAVAATRATDTVQLTDDAKSLSTLHKTLDSIPGVNHSRVASIKQAVAEGRYKIDPEAIASRLSHFEWQRGG